MDILYLLAQILPERFCSGIGHMVAPLPTKFPFLKMDGTY